MVQAIAAQFDAQRAQILAHLDTTRIGKSYGTKSKLTYTKKDWLNDLLDWAQAAVDFKTAIQPTIHAVLLETGRSATQDVGLEPSQFDPFTPALIAYFQNRSMKIAKDVNDETEKQLRATLSKGAQEGKSSYELRADVEDIMGNASTVRADRIARTEVARAQGYADIQAWTQSGVVSGKEWYTAEDEMVCFACSAFDGKVQGLDENFADKGDTIAGEGKQSMALNYDDIPSPALHPNCRCTLLPVRG